ncbi:prepilin-type N-terminal cleavage/methylation domain-containing protein [Streptomyces sp. NPDC090303]|uniref:prepilin-type N-terminal cleavage/methylation domain-containing protein n=1 Tax=Streptomyces sp. NPDC090303 TaxID=3365960 RepID=UPI00381C5917
MTARRRTGRPESGFTLTELLVTIVIVGIIAVVLPRAIVLGLRFTADTGKRVAATGAQATLNSYFYGDVRSADAVTTDPACGVTDVIVHLRRTDTDVVYAYDRPTGVLHRVTCSDGDVVSTSLGRFDPAAPNRPVTLSCGAETPCTSPLEVTLTVQSNPAAPPTALTAVRRASTS